MIRIEKDV